MKKFLSVLAVAAGAVAMAAVTDQPAKPRIDSAQIPKWSADDLDFFLHGSMSMEVVPERVLRAFIKIYPDLFPASDLTYLGLIPDPQFGWPIGFSRKNEVKHLGGLSAVGINCASCHVAQITSNAAKEPIRILGVTSHFDVEAFFGAVLVSTFKTSEPASMKLFLAAYFSNPSLDAAWEAQQGKITETMAADPFDGKDVAGDLNEISPAELEMAGDVANLPQVAHSMLKLFHNMRAALHVPDQPPEKAPPVCIPSRKSEPIHIARNCSPKNRHNGSVRTMQDLLTSPAQRAKTFKRGSQDYDANQMGYTDAGAYVFETTSEGNSNSGHDYGTKLSAEQKRELMEYLKTL